MMAKLAAVVIASTCTAVAAWGDDGHKIIAQIAADLLGPEEQAKAVSMAGADSLVDIATWADEVRNEAAYKWSAPLHFINNPDGTCTFNYDVTCKDDWCAAGAILNFTKVAMAQSSQALVKDAMRFVVHFVGDLHQPLHCGWTTDLGGNRIRVTEGFLDNKESELHAVWDYGMIDRVYRNGGYSDWSGYEKVLAEKLPQDNCLVSTTAQGLKACVEQIAQESLTLACQRAYRDEAGNVIANGATLDEKYYTSRRPIVDSQVQKAGVRLAAFLKFIVAGAAPAPAPSPSPSLSPQESLCKTYGCGEYVKGRDCQCNESCESHGDCCPDYEAACGNGSIRFLV